MFFRDQSSVYVLDTLPGMIEDILHYLYFLCRRGETPPGWPRVTHSLSLPSHDSKSTREHLRTGDMAGQTGLGKSKDRYTRNLLKKKESGKLAKRQMLKRRPMSADPVSEISNDVTCRGDAEHEDMSDVETCACHSL